MTLREQATAGGRELGHVVRTHWLRWLLTLLGAFEVLMALGSRPELTLVVGVICGLALTRAPWAIGSPRLRLTLLIIGVVPFTVLTWWSVATPLLAIVALALGPAVILKDAGTTRR
jgi:hypothetical protein